MYLFLGMSAFVENLYICWMYRSYVKLKFMFYKRYKHGLTIIIIFLRKLSRPDDAGRPRELGFFRDFMGVECFEEEGGGGGNLGQDCSCKIGLEGSLWGKLVELSKSVIVC